MTITTRIWLLIAWVTLGFFLPREPAQVMAADFADPPRYCHALALRVDASLRAVAFQNPQLGIAVGAHGAMLRTNDGGAHWHPIESTVVHALDDVAWLNERQVIAVGGAYDPITHISRGVVVFSNDGGARWWRAADRELPRLRNIQVRPGDSALIATGDWSPLALSQEFESHDGGRTWSATEGLNRNQAKPDKFSAAELVAWVKATQIPVVIRDACRVGREGLCAVGDHGVIVQRTDDHAPWEVKQGANNQTGILVVAASGALAPWPLMGRESLQTNTRCALVLLNTNSSRKVDGTASPVDLARQAAANIGVSSVDATSADVINNWMIVHRPAVVVVDQSLDQPTRAAVTEAAIAYGAQRVVGYSYTGRGEMTLHRSALLPTTGVLASDLWQDALQIVAPDQSPQPAIALRRLYDSAGNSLRGESVSTTVKLTRGQTLAAIVEPATRRHLQITQARIKHEQQIANLIAGSRHKTDFAAGLKSLLDQTAKGDQLRLAWTIWQRLERSQVTADVVGFSNVVLDEIQARFEDTSLAMLASLRQESIRHSSEWDRLRMALANSIDHSQVRTAGAEPVHVSPFQVKQVLATAPVQVPDTSPVDATQQTRRSNAIDLHWELHPLVLVTREAARLRGDSNQLQAANGSSANFQQLMLRGNGAWSRLLRTNGPGVIAAHATTVPPRLDGKLNDPCWQSIVPSAANRQRVRCAYDENYVYIAMVTPHELFQADPTWQPSDQIRDHDLTSVDRIHISIDTDVDLLSSLQLQFSRTGHTHDSIDGHPQWQPTWYVDSKPDGENIVTEIAILRRDLVDLPIVAGQSWFLRVKTFAANLPTSFDSLPRASAWQRIVFH